MDLQEKQRPFTRIDILDMRASLPGISGGGLKVWLAYLLRANADGIAWPGLSTLAQDTGLSKSRLSKIRNELLNDGWLVSEGTGRGNHGTFGSPRLRPVIPQSRRTLKTAHGESAVRQESGSPYAENDSHRALKTAHEVVPLKKNPSEVERSAGALTRRFGTTRALAIDGGDPTKFDEVIV